MLRVIHGREQLLELGRSLTYLESLRDAVLGKNPEVAFVYLNMASMCSAHAAELMKDSVDHPKMQSINFMLSKVERRITSWRGKFGAGEDHIKICVEINTIANKVRPIVAELQYRYQIEDRQ